MAEIDVDGVKVNTDTPYTATVQSSFIDSAGLPWADLAVKELPNFGPMKVYFHCGTFEEVPFRNLSNLLPKDLEIQVKVRAYDLRDVREKSEYDKGWRLKVTAARAENPDSRKKLESMNQRAPKVEKHPRVIVEPPGDETLRASANSFHTKDIQTFSEAKKFESAMIRISGTGKFTLIDLATGNVLASGANHAENVSLFQWTTPPEGIQSLGIKFMGSRELSLRLLHIETGEACTFKLLKV